MHRCFLLMVIGILLPVVVPAQNMAEKATHFIRLLSPEQRSQALFPFDTSERYHFSYIPRDDRKGIAVKALNTAQREALMALLGTALSAATVKKVNDIMQLEVILKDLEHRAANDTYRDPGKYYVTIFGVPGTNTIWGWRFEGHHAAFNFSGDKNELVAATPAFLGSNPAVVPEGADKGKEILREETVRGFTLIQALTTAEREKALIATAAPAEIITGANRQAMIAHPAGIHYSDMSAASQQLLLALISVYVHRYTKLFADDMLKEIQQAGLDQLCFAWAGSMERIPGKPYYYRIQGPTLIIEYDNTQNNANHVHTVVRDLKRDFGGDVLLEHYRDAHR